MHDRTRNAQTGPLDPYTPPTARDAPAPPVRYAASYERARVGEVVLVDPSGRPMSPLRRTLFRAFPWILLPLALAFCVVVALAFDAWFLRLEAALVALVAVLAIRGVILRRTLVHTVAFIAAGRLDEARVRLERVRDARLARIGFRAAVHAQLGAIAMLQGRHAQALHWYMAALSVVPRRQAWRRFAVRQGIVVALCSLGRMDEAEAQLTLLAVPSDAVPMLAAHRWRAELYLSCCAGRLACSDAELARRADHARRVEIETGLLALCAWQYAMRNEPDRARELLAIVRTRPRPDPIGAAMPPLGAWMDAQPTP